MVLDLVIIGLGIAVFPLSVAAFVLVLSADRGVWKGLAFILAWLACFVGVLAIVLLTTGGEPPAPKSPPSTAASALKLAIGLGLLAYGWHRHRHRADRRTARGSDAPDVRGAGEAQQTGEPLRAPESGEARDAPADGEARKAGKAGPTGKASGRMAAELDHISMWTAAGLGPLLQPWGMVAAGAATVVNADLSQTSSFIALFVYCLIATSSLLTMELYTTFAPDAARERLGRLRSWLQNHQEQAIVVVVLIVGLFLVARSIHQLTS
ncbi:GAP family protein [Streptomyces sp. NRRL S-87]|uniref:GAP family protein n=1 Tax=Streptomyces sp. NRRL S-87 TaxID=1463920 RepID=UPI0004C281C5|nr:GAP family protein [Streptomyces sp. NRRL S-87]